jgi:hypothetical protein
VFQFRSKFLNTIDAYGIFHYKFSVRLLSFPWSIVFHRMETLGAHLISTRFKVSFNSWDNIANRPNELATSNCFVFIHY